MTTTDCKTLNKKNESTVTKSETARENRKRTFASIGEDSSTKSLLWKLVIKQEETSNYPAFFFRRNCSSSPVEVGKIYRIPTDKRGKDDRKGGVSILQTRNWFRKLLGMNAENC